jgi:Ca2+-binding RTX toxin-like protein
MPLFNGTANADTINGTSGSDTINGLGGDDILRGLGGADALDGGSGFDGAFYENDSANGGSAGIIANLSTGVATDGFGNTDTLISIEMIRGTAFADSVTGSNRTDETEMFQGLAGNDTFNGLGGFDEMRYDRDANFGGTGAVNVNLVTGLAIDGFGNTDTLINVEASRGTAQADTFLGNSLDNEFRGLGGNDTFDGGFGFDVLRYDSDQSNGGAAGITANFTGAGSGTVTDGFGATDTFIGIEGIRATAFADTFNGFGNGSEEFFGLAGNDTLNGGNGTGFDWARYDRDSVTGGNAGVTASLTTGLAADGFGNTDTLNGIEGVRGTNVADSLSGDTNANGFVGQAGNDTINGGDGYDYINYASNGESGTLGITANLITGIVTDSFGNTDTVSNIEDLRTGNFNDSLTGSNVGESFSGNGGNDTFVGGGGGDFMRGGAGNDRLDGSAATGAFVDMSSGDRDTAAYNDSGITQGIVVNLDTGTATDGFGNTDTLIDIERVRGTFFADSITGSSTANIRQERFEGLNGNDTMNGQAGYDMAVYSSDASNGGAAGVTVNLATGIATDGFGATDTLLSIEGIISTNGNDSLVGNGANNVFRSLGGNDTIDGAGGEDTLDLYVDDQIGGEGAVVNLVEGDGTGTNIFGGTMTLISIEDVDGSYRNDTITGSIYANNLSGSLGNDSINGSDGDDTINGGAGADTLIGGNGNDWLSYSFDTTDSIQNGVDANAIAANFGWTTQNWNWTGVNVNLSTGVMSGLDGAVDTISGFENIAGTYYNDTLTGDGNDNRFRGYAGNDVIDGGGGSDTVIYSATYSRTSGIALALIVGEAPNGVNVNLTTGIAQDGSGGTDTLTSIENVIGSLGNDSITGSTSIINTLRGGAGNDLYYGVESNDVVVELAGEGTDSIYVNYAAVVAGNNIENVYVGIGVTGTASVLGNAENNIIVASTAAQNTLQGLSGNDSLTSGTQGDVIDGGTGDDTMTGGGGSDVYYVDSAADVVVEQPSDGFDTVYTTATYTLTANVEQLVALGGATLTGTGNSGDNNMDATLRGNGVTFNGLDGADNIYGSNYADSLSGGNGNDILLAYLSVNGSDTLVGGAGDDVYYLFENGDTIVELANEGFDTVYTQADAVLFDNVEQVVIYGAASIITGNAGNNNLFGLNSSIGLTLNGMAGNDWIMGSNQSDTLNGGADNDILQGLGGTNVMNGGTGDDVYYSTSAADVVNENLGEGRDTVYANYNMPALAADVEQLVSYGGATIGNGNGLDNTLYGNNNTVGMTIDGFAGADLIFGSNFADTIIGGFGNDIMLGLTGDDRFAYTAAGNMGTDLIIGFDADPTGGQDRIDLTGRGYLSTDIGGVITLTNSGGSTLVTFTSGGSLAGTTIMLSGVAAANVTASDFLF